MNPIKRFKLGKLCTVALGLISRASFILDTLKSIDLEMEYDDGMEYNSKYPLHGLKVIIYDTCLVSAIQYISSTRFPSGTNMFEVS